MYTAFKMHVCLHRFWKSKDQETKFRILSKQYLKHVTYQTREKDLRRPAQPTLFLPFLRVIKLSLKQTINIVPIVAHVHPM